MKFLRKERFFYLAAVLLYVVCLFEAPPLYLRPMRHQMVTLLKLILQTGRQSIIFRMEEVSFRKSGNLIPLGHRLLVMLVIVLYLKVSQADFDKIPVGGK